MDAEELKNQYNQGIRDFFRANLRGADLRWADLREANLQEADLQGADLRGANLQGADLRKAYLRRAYLQGAYLQGAYLQRAYLRGANLQGADLRKAYLRGADLRKAYLRGADLQEAGLQEADLQRADLRGADLRGVDLPSPTIVLLAFWGEVSDELCQNLMQYDAWFHQNPEAFENWAINDECPYNDALYQRSANFEEKKHLFKPGIPPRGFDLMIQVIREKCKDSDYHDK